MICNGYSLIKTVRKLENPSQPSALQEYDGVLGARTARGLGM